MRLLIKASRVPQLAHAWWRSPADVIVTILYLALANSGARPLVLPRLHGTTPGVPCLPAFARDKSGGTARLLELRSPLSGFALYFGLRSDRSDDCGDVRARRTVRFECRDREAYAGIREVDMAGVAKACVEECGKDGGAECDNEACGGLFVVCSRSSVMRKRRCRSGREEDGRAAEVEDQPFRQRGLHLRLGNCEVPRPGSSSADSLLRQKRCESPITMATCMLDLARMCARKHELS